MYAIHTMLTFASAEKSIYRAQVVSCRWTDKKKGKWSGRAMRDTGDFLEFIGHVHTAEIRARCDSLSREVAARLGMASGPDEFPFS